MDGERNGKGKEYNHKGELIFEGEFLNGKRWNGKGKIEEFYYNSSSIESEFEGEYKDGKIWNGKRKEYYKSNELKFDVEYLNGKKWNGKAYIMKYIDNDYLEIEGEYLDGKLKLNEDLKNNKYSNI